MPPSRQNTSRRLQSTRNQASSSTLNNVRTTIRKLFTGRSSVGSRIQPPESPKTPRSEHGLQNLPTTRIDIPDPTRSASDITTSSSPRTPRSPHTPSFSQPITRNSLRQHLEQENVSTIPPHVRHNSAGRFVGVDPAEQYLAQLAHDGRRRRKIKPRHKERRCAPKVRNKRVRSKILACFISGLILTLVLTIYIALTLTNRRESQAFHVLLLLIILVVTIIFCHGLIRLCMMMIHPPPENRDVERQLPPVNSPGGYANPPQPIRVALARDEEAAGIECEATKLPPPVYGLWRESVRVDPNRIFWQRNAEAALERQNPVNRPGTGNRPPSYISDNGIDYVVEAQSRSIAPTTDVPLPPHPSERGRAWEGI